MQLFDNIDQEQGVGLPHSVKTNNGHSNRLLYCFSKAMSPFMKPG